MITANTITTANEFQSYLEDLKLFRWTITETKTAFEATLSSSCIPLLENFTSVLRNEDGTWWVRLAKVDCKPENRVRFYEGSYQFAESSTHLNITEDYILMKLAKQYEYRETDEILWAELTIGNDITRYVLDYNNKTLITK